MKNLLLLITLLVLGTTNAFASHLMGGEITYTYVGGNDYEVTLIIYGDCDGIAVGTNQTVTFESASCGQNFTFNIPFIQTIDISQVCPGQSTTCNGGTIAGTEQNIFRGIVTLTPCSDWIMHWNQGNRNPAITNLVNPNSTNLFIQNTLNNIIGANNNSPQFFNAPTPYLCINQLAIYSHAASDPDGDSLYYSFSNPLTTPGPPGTNIPFVGGYTLLQPMLTSAGMNLNQTTGEMCFIPSQAQISVVSVIIEEYRNGILIGTQIREMQVVVDPNCTNQNPTTGVGATCGGAAALTITQQGPSVVQIDPNSVVMCPNDNVCFEVNFSDPDGDNITLSNNVAAAIPTATFTVANNGTPNPIATFCWIPTPLDSGLNVFAIIATDDACPISGTQSFVFDVTVFDQPYAGLDDTICGTQQAQLTAQGGAGYVWSVITGDPIVMGTNFSCISCTSPLASPSITTTYLLTSSLTAACVNTDTVTIVVVPDITPTAFGDTTLCDFLTKQIGVNVNPVGVYSYQWFPATTLNNSTIANPIATPIQTTTYTVLTTSTLGCAKLDSATITVVPPPNVTLVPGDTTICQGDNIQFDVSLAALNDEFTGGFDAAIWSNVSGASVGTPCVPFNGDALIFDSGTRELTTNSMSVTNCTSVDFCLWIANNNSSGACENADLGEDVVLNYSTSGAGGPWITIQTFTTGDWDTGGPYANAWQCFSVNIPPAAQTGATMFQWTQIGGYGATIDNWALDDISINCGGSTAYSFSWSPANLYATNIPNPILNNVTNTTVYTVTITDPSSGCSIDRAQTITVVPNYTLTTTQTDTAVCLAQTVDFNTTITPAGAYNYIWSPSGIFNNATIANPTATFNTPGLNEVTLLVDNGGGCVKADTFYVNVAAAVIPNITILTPDSIINCGDSILIDLDLGGGVPTICGPSATNACSGPTTQLTLGNNTGANTTTSWPAPYGNYYRNAKHQFLFTAAELNAMGFNGGKITEIAWEITTINGTTTYNNYQIKMGCTSTNNLTTWENGLTPVFGSPIIARNINIITGWNTHVFDVAYEWDGVSNLVIEICYDNLATSFTNNSITPWTTTPFTSSIWYRSDSQNACPSTTNTGTGSNRPITRFTQCPTIPDPASFTYSWTPNTNIITSTLQNPNIFPSTSTPYEVTVMDLTGSCFDTDSINIDVICPTCYQPSITVTNPTCKDGNDGKIIINPTFGLGSEVQSFTWKDSITNTILQTTTNLTTGMQDSLINIGAGAYTISLLDTSGCTKDTTIWLIEPDSVKIDDITSDDIICIGESIQIDATAIGGNGGSYTYTWTDLSTGSTLPIINGPQTVNPIVSPTCYSVFATDPLGCLSNSNSIVCINLYNPITASTTNPNLIICPNSSTPIDISATGGSGAGYFYEWFENGSSIGFGATINVTPTSAPTVYTGIAKENCTTPSDNITVTVDWFPMVTPSFTRNKPDSCYPITIDFINTSSPLALIDPATIMWSSSNGDVGVGNTFSSTFNSANCQDVTLFFNTIDGCPIDTTYPDFICPHDYPSADFISTPPITDIFNPEIDFTNFSSGKEPLTYLWNFNSGLTLDTSVATNPVFNFPNDSAGIYPVTLTVTDSNTCETSITGNVIINSVYLFYVPSSFTPNGDGLNDEFRAYGEGIELSSFSMQIFDRWGGLLYETNVIENGWNGSYKGKLVPVGTYIWKIIAKEESGTVIHDNFGHITIIR
ncbi:MAG: gliding motility-associated C-terminal domain-containing protein [Flavobacteriales bacterium]|nr:gliding motility-associated C-terminal domain-containing protein [Flavobacteriales bacterium]